MTASRYAPFAWVPLGRQTQPRMRSHDVVCFHTMVGSLSGTRAMFKRNGYAGTESHFGVGEDGHGDQWQDLAFTADANYDGNSYVISIENADYGGVFGRWNTRDGSAVPAFTTAQVKRLIDLGTALALPGRAPGSLHAGCPKSWRCYVSGIPAELIKDTKPGRRGFGYHAQGVAGQGLVPGGIRWSTAYGKVCPGARRIKQVKEIIIPGIARRLAGEDDMDLNDKVNNVWVPPAKPGAPATFTDSVTVNEVMRRASRNFWLGVEQRDISRKHTEMLMTIQAQQAAIMAALQGLDSDAITASINEAVDKAQKAIEAMQIKVIGGDIDA